MYREYKPNILLTPYIETYWATDENILDSQTLRILPDGSVNVLFNLAENEDCVIKPFIPYIIGAKTIFSDVVHENADRMIGVRFRPCALSAYMKIPIYEFNNCRVNTNLFLSLFADFDSERLAEIEGEIERLNYIERYLLNMLGRLYDVDKRFAYVAEYIRMTKGMVPVNELLDKVCLSQRQFERQFKYLTGMTPKIFSAVTRFSSSEKYIRLHPDKSLFTIALDCGYYDHSHLIREFKRFGGTLPQTLMSNLYTISPSFPYYLCAPKKCKGYGTY